MAQSRAEHISEIARGLERTYIQEGIGTYQMWHHGEIYAYVRPMPAYGKVCLNSGCAWRVVRTCKNIPEYTIAKGVGLTAEDTFEVTATALLIEFERPLPRT